MTQQNEPVTLARRIGLFSLIVYGVGDMIGSGIYGTIGVAAGAMGNAVWLAFLISMFAAMLTGLSYASLGSRYPKAGGASYVMQRAFKRPFLSYVVGLAVAASGLTSMAAAANVFASTLIPVFPEVPVKGILIGFVVLLAVVNLVGIKESMRMNLICTAVEVGGLIFIIIVGAKYWGNVDYLEVPDGASLTAPLLLGGAVLTFYSFVGFEDMINVSEEVKNPERNMPKGILYALLIATVLYMAISITAVSVVPYTDLANPEKGAPLVQLTGIASPWLPGWVFGAITLFAVANTALLNYIMSSRMLYGMSNQKLLPDTFGKVHVRFRTPYMAILFLGGVVLILSLIGNIAQLASATSLLLLACFCLVNAALVILQRREGEPPGRLEIPAFIPVLGFLVCGGLIFARVTAPNAEPRAPFIALGLVVLISIVYYFMRPAEVLKTMGK